MHKLDPIERLPDGTLFRLTPGQLRSVPEPGGVGRTDARLTELSTRTPEKSLDTSLTVSTAA